MTIDVIALALLAMAIWKGYSRGLVVAIFSLLAIIIGLAAAMKLSVVVAGWLGKTTNIGEVWIPVLSFALVMIAVAILVKWVASIIDKTIQFAMLGWINKIGGIIFYTLLYLSVYSIILFYSTQIGLFTSDTIAASKTYAYIEPFGPKVISIIASILPFFKDMFIQLTGFFSMFTHNA